MRGGGAGRGERGERGYSEGRGKRGEERGVNGNTVGESMCRRGHWWRLLPPAISCVYESGSSIQPHPAHLLVCSAWCLKLFSTQVRYHVDAFFSGRPCRRIHSQTPSLFRRSFADSICKPRERLLRLLRGELVDQLVEHHRNAMLVQVRHHLLRRHRLGHCRCRTHTHVCTTIHGCSGGASGGLRRANLLVKEEMDRWLS